MIKKRKNPSEDYPSDLPDVNEQELAKDIGTTPKRLTDTSTDTGKDRSENYGESLPENISTEYKAAAATDNSLPPREEYPRLTAGDRPKEEKGGTAENQVDAKKTKGVGGGGKYTALIVLCLLVSATAVFFSARGRSTPPPQGSESVNNTEQNTPPTDTEAERPQNTSSAADIYKKAAASTATIISEKDGEREYYSGFCLFDGFVATVSDAALGERISVVCADGRSYPASIRGSLPTVGLALLETDAPLLSASLGNCASLAEGDGIYAVVGADGERFDFSLLSASVSRASGFTSVVLSDGTARQANVLQISNICAGKIAGSPLFDKNGRLVAMAIGTNDSESGSCLALSINASFAVLQCMHSGTAPSQDVMAAVAYTPAALGILGTDAENNGVRGIEVRGFTDSECSAAAMLRTGDLIYQINTSAVASTDALAEQIKLYLPSDTVEIFVLRHSQRLSFRIKLCSF